MTGRLLSLAAALLGRLGLLLRGALPVPARTAPLPALPAPAADRRPVTALSLGLPGRYTPLTGGEP